jgi:uncharacterized protein (TIGR00255 family)
MSNPIRSMTGFARETRNTEYGEIVVGIKSVNHRGLDLHFHLGSEMEPFEQAMREAVKRAVLRGHIDIRASLARPAGTEAAGLNERFLKAYLASFRKIAAQEGITAEPDLNAALRVPGMFNASETGEPDPAAESVILSVFESALASLNKFRSREGMELAAVIRQHNQSLSSAAQEMELIRTRALAAFQARLSERLRELLQTAGIEPQRLAQEAAILADRSDIHEEIARLKIHSRQLGETLDAGGEVGKKLDFLLQEMNRETNTILSKTSGVGEPGLRITDLALAAKANIEKMREQSLNLE